MAVYEKEMGDSDKQINKKQGQRWRRLHSILHETLPSVRAPTFMQQPLSR